MKKKDVLKYFGNSIKTARALGICKQAVTNWKADIPPMRAFQIESLTNGELKVTQSEKKPLFKKYKPRKPKENKK